jgi:hypothetical protein
LDYSRNGVLQFMLKTTRQLFYKTNPIPVDNQGKRIGILVVAYNAVTTLSQVFKRIPSDVWDNVEEVVVFDDASEDDTYALGIGYKSLSKNEVINTL